LTGIDADLMHVECMYLMSIWCTYVNK
jgi:hypothetical protein